MDLTEVEKSFITWVNNVYQDPDQLAHPWITAGLQCEVEVFWKLIFCVQPISFSTAEQNVWFYLQRRSVKIVTNILKSI
jgi:hypothetical protein